MGIYESSFGMRVARVTMMLCLPVAILLGLAYLRPATEPWQALLWAFGMTWLMDQVGSFAMFYRRQQMSYRAERWFLRLNLASTIAAKLYLMSDWYSGSMCWRVALGAGLIAALDVAKIVDNLWDTHFRVRPRICWSDARCVEQCRKLLGWLKRDKEQMSDSTEHFQAQAPPNGGEEAEVFEVRIPETVEEDQSVHAEIYRVVEEVMAEKNGMTVAEQQAETVVVQCSFLEMMRQQNVEREPDAATVEWPGPGQKAVATEKQQPSEEPVAARGDVKARPPTRTQARLKPWTPHGGRPTLLWQTQQASEKKYFWLAIVMGVFLGQAGIWLGARSLATLVRTNYWLAIMLTGCLIMLAAGLLKACFTLVSLTRIQAWTVWMSVALLVSGGCAYVISRTPSWQLIGLELGGVAKVYDTLDTAFAVSLGLAVLTMVRYTGRLYRIWRQRGRSTQMHNKPVYDWKRGFERVDSLEHVMRMACGLE